MKRVGPNIVRCRGCGHVLKAYKEGLCVYCFVRARATVVEHSR